MNKLQAGFARVNINPMLGINIAGYFQVRLADKILDDLEANCLALAVEDSKVVLITFDLCGPKDACYDIFRQAVSDATGLPSEAIFISATHTHTGPIVDNRIEDPLIQDYIKLLSSRLADVAVLALQDLKPAKMGWGIGQAPNVAFVRRFRMKDGSIQTNPGVNNPNILEPIGTIDERVNVLRFDREDGDTIVLANFGNHPDTVGGCGISGDWPNFARRTVEKVLDNTKCIFFNGAQGDVNHVNVHPKGGDFNGMFNDFDDVSRGYSHARHIGNVVTGAVLQVFEKVCYQDVESLKAVSHKFQLPSNMPTPEEMPEARRINEMHLAGRDAELPYKGMMLTTMVADAARKIRLEHGPESFGMELTGIAIGPVAMIGIPGEPFNDIGLGIKDTEGWDTILPCCLTNGSIGYFPTMNAYTEGGYEAKSSPFKAGVAERIVAEAKLVLGMLKED